MYIPKEIIGCILDYLGIEKFKYSIICKEWNIVLQNFWKWSTHVSMRTLIKFHTEDIIKRLRERRIIIDKLFTLHKKHDKSNRIKFKLYIHKDDECLIQFNGYDGFYCHNHSQFGDGGWNIDAEHGKCQYMASLSQIARNSTKYHLLPEIQEHILEHIPQVVLYTQEKLLGYLSVYQ